MDHGYDQSVVGVDYYRPDTLAVVVVRHLSEMVCG